MKKIFTLLMTTLTLLGTPREGEVITPTLLEFLQKMGVAHDGSLKSIVALTQAAWIRPPGKERWEVAELAQAQKEITLAYAEKLGLIREIFPDKKEYDYGFLLGATVFRMQKRLNYLVELWEKGVRFREIVILTGARPLDPSVEHIYDGCATETDAAHYLWEKSDLPHEMRQLKVTFVDVPMRMWMRPTTADTFYAWLELNPLPGSCLLISNQPYCLYQKAVAELVLPPKFKVGVAGEGTNTEREKAAVLLDTVAKTLYQYSQMKRASVSFVACHGGPADHFATFADYLTKKGYEVEIYAAGAALEKLQGRKVTAFSLDSPAEEIARKCSKASVVITDVGHPFDVALQKALSIEAPKTLRLAYYDNPEPYVPGGYSSMAAEVMLAAQRVVFANANLASAPIYREPDREVDLPFAQRCGLGYYPVGQAEKIAAQRKERQNALRSKFFSQYSLKDQGQKVLVYFGGNNEEYFTKAFPAFLGFLAEGSRQFDFSNFVIVMQEHPGAKNRDRQKIESWVKEHRLSWVMSDWSSEDVQIVADGVLYYQTSMGPQLALAGIPLIQVGHKTYPDIVVRHHLCPSVTETAAFLKAIQALKQEGEGARSVIFSSLGIRSDWGEELEMITRPY